ncbi:MAG: DUF502 domain-containing protein [Nitrospirae bacterium]|nr:DUF502 domain-containing protein [Nitrospirota bacterium]MBU6481624.1 DUF502 domain-containing protein [Nitrospirota bacterium]MDE3039141.1 DUF502 domain-containing protein [Nitrospirota bacterium]MDE3050993.1 DUF502 domain-containing protein [Nitrospirota bacterium]MDE3221038.1 DUF502 domain-containing protein [Nitrospirota bacterium]
MSKTLWQYSLAGLLVLVPAWATFLILSTLFHTLNELSRDLPWNIGARQNPGLSLVLFLFLVVIIGAIATHVIGRRMITQTERWIEHIPLVRSVYITLKGMTDLLNFRTRFGHSTVVAFPFPRDGLWAIGFVMGAAPPALQVAPTTSLLMVFVPTAIHPFTGFLAFVPQPQLRPINLPPEDAIKMEFTAGLYKPETGWLQAPKRTA